MEPASGGPLRCLSPGIYLKPNMPGGVHGAGVLGSWVWDSRRIGVARGGHLRVDARHSAGSGYRADRYEVREQVVAFGRLFVPRRDDANPGQDVSSAPRTFNPPSVAAERGTSKR